MIHYRYARKGRFTFFFFLSFGLSSLLFSLFFVPLKFGLFVSRTRSIRFLLPLVAMPRLSVPVETAPTDR